MRRALLVGLAVLMPFGAAAQVEDPRVQADRLLRTFVENGANAFLDAVLTDTTLGDSPAARRSIADNRPRWLRDIEGLGIVLDHVYAGERRYAPVLKTLCNVVRFRRAPLMFSFRYFQTTRGWELLHYAWHSQDSIGNWECAAGAPLVLPQP